MIGLILLLSMCCGLANAARGSGIKNMKWPVLIALQLSASVIWSNTWYTIGAMLPLMAFWWQPGGTGKWMKEIIEFFEPFDLGDNTWRFFEFFSVFMFMLIYLLIGYYVSH